MAKICKKTLNDTIVKFEFVNGEVLECNVHTLSGNIKAHALMHGISQKVGDSYASAESVEQAIMNANATWDMLSNGDWTSKRSIGTSAICEAISRVQNVSIDVAINAYNKLDDNAKNEIKRHPKVKLEMALIAKERAEAKLANMPSSNNATDLNTLIQLEDNNND